MAFDEQSTKNYLAFRVAIASGLFASLGATLAWILWIAYKAWSAELGITIVVGGVIGLMVHWCGHYLKVASRERDGLFEEEDEEGTSSSHHHSRVAIVWATGFGFLGLVSEHLVAHMAATYLQPFLASLATLLPAGVILGLFFHYGNSESRKLSDFLVRGLSAGAAIAVTTGTIWWLAWGTAPWLALFSWWALVGIGVQFFVPAEANATRFYQPLCGILVAFCLMVALTFLPSGGSLYKSSGPVSTFAFVARVIALSVVTSPDVPASPWVKADQPVGASAQAPNPGQSTTPLAGSPPDPLALNSMGREIDLIDKRAKDPHFDENSILESLNRAGTSAENGLTWHSVLAEMEKGLPSPLFRSWLVLILFGVGLGVAPEIERRLRPSDYPSSATFRKDITLAVALLLAVVAACFTARAIPQKASTDAPASSESSPHT